MQALYQWLKQEIKHWKAYQSPISEFPCKIQNKNYGELKVSLGELEIIIKTYTSIPTDQELDKMFASNYQISYDVSQDKSKLRVFFTSRRFLFATVHVTHINLDGTYKFIWNGFPVIMIGTTDICKHYHHFGLAFTKSETASDYEFFCNSLKIAVSKIN